MSLFKRLILIIFLLTFVQFLPASTQIKGYNGLFELAYPFTLAKGTAGFTFGVNNIDLKSADIDVNRFFLGAAWGVVDQVELNLNFSYNRVKRKDFNIINVEYPFAAGWQEGLGYASLGVKVNFLKSDTTGIGALGFVDIPLSDEQKGVTTSKLQTGIDLLLAHRLGEHTILSANAGYQINQQPDTHEIGNIFRYGVGVEAGLSKMFSLAGQLLGKIYTGNDLPSQDNPLDVIVGIKYGDSDKYGISIGYKKNIAFNNKTLGDSHGAIGTVWVKTGKSEPKAPPCFGVEATQINGPSSAMVGESHSFNAQYSPNTASLPITYSWLITGAELIAGQGSPTIEVKFMTAGSATIQVTVANGCSNQVATLKPTVAAIEEKIAPKNEFFFAFDSYELGPSLKTDLDEAIKYYKHHPDITIELQGHTCSVATEEYNLALGQHRSEAVKSYLIENGVTPDRIKVISFGEEKPAYDNSAENSRKMNRRVYIPLTEQEK